MKNKTLYPIILALAVCLGILLGTVLDFSHSPFALNNAERREQKLRQVMRYIDHEYVDSVNSDSLLDEAIVSVLQQLDPHSVYIPHSEVQRSEESIRGSFVGIGIEFKIFQDSLTVVRVLPEGPAEKAGLRSGMRILKADTVALSGTAVNTEQVLRTLKGKKGSVVDLELYDPLKDQVMKESLQRDEVPVRSVSSVFMANDTVGFLKLIRFTQRSAEEFKEAIVSLKEKGASSLILDMRDNPGGLLHASELISDEFLEKDELIVFTKNRRGREKRVKATGNGHFRKGKVAVLINEGTASASEIVAGALQDNDRAVIIGRRSFGKGLVQEEVGLSDGSRLRLTTQRYYTPTGRSIQKDFADYDSDFHSSEGGKPEKNWHEPGVDSAEGKSSELRSFETPGGRTVYGGGGIFPDREISRDSSQHNDLLYYMAMSYDLNDRAFAYVDEHRRELAHYSEASFLSDFTIGSRERAFFLEDISEEELEEFSAEEREMLYTRLKAAIAFNFLGRDTYYKILSETDPYVQEALRAMNEKLLNVEAQPQP